MPYKEEVINSLHFFAARNGIDLKEKTLRNLWEKGIKRTSVLVTPGPKNAAFIKMDDVD